ncbi:MAG TPA: endonuclease domain-containing protein [Chiayiivirga sp.]|nr:endonuclease domain-containing protein [Chiayiivirga sp.]
MRTGTKLSMARSLRKTMTEAERKLWHRLRLQQLGVKFRRQHPVGPFIADFACLEPRLIVEVDGSQHLDSATDAQRDAYLQAQGFLVRRYWNHDVLMATDAVVEDILGALAEAGHLNC